jgi:hypothetical protein
MVLKRKRSESDFGSVFSSTQRLDNRSFDFTAMSAMDTARRGFFAQRLTTPAHLPSRTMKRFRDNRPSESDVYRKFNQDQLQPQHSLTSVRLPTEHTLDVLYSAQRRPDEPHHGLTQSPTHTSTELLVQAHAQSHHIPQQRSLHSFWNLPGPSSSTSSLASSPSSSAATSPPSPALAPRSILTNCEDCGAGLGGGDDDVMMDADDHGPGLEEDQTCGACGKTVCFSCSISNLGEHRRCLACAGPKGAAGGSVWMRR